MTATPNFASGARTEDRGQAAPALSAGPFVLNLCSSTTPMALAQTDLPELRRFHFFVSRRFEEGRERFRLHMGYFATLAEAEEWLGVVREIYPGAWAGETPGRKLRERAAAAAAAQAQHAAGPQPQLTAAPASAPAAPVRHEAPRAIVTPPAPTRVPVVHAAPPAARRAAPAPALAPSAAQTPAPQAAPPPAAASGAPAVAARLAAAMRATPPARTAGKAVPGAPPAAARPSQTMPPARPAAPAAASPPRNVPVARPAAPAAASRPAAAAPVVPAPAPRPPPVTTSTGAPKPAKSAVKPVFEDSNVREVLKALGDASATGETRLMRAPPPPPRESAPAPAPPSLSDTQVLKMLETRRADESEVGPPEVDDSGIPLLKPDDTGTRLALKEAVVSNDAVAFAVQLQWSVQPVELEKVPALAIFSAYTLYTVEGSRDGRRWYGLRLGFFSDAISAKQVAYYVRSEFSSVAVVPVSPQEKGRATDQDAAAALAAPAPLRSDPMDEFKLIDDEPPQIPVPAKPAIPARPAAAKGAQPTPKVAVGRTVVQPSASQPAARARARVAARENRGPQTLEETLEILGASQLTIDNGRGETLNDTGVRHLRVEVQKNSPFSKLLERLSERMKKS
ncbi:MAG: hypothetical protein ACTHL7_12510 [Steroidobacteraceae bacterium]